MSAILQKFWIVLRRALFWICLLLPMAIAVGSVVAFFLKSLDVVTQCRFDHPWLLFLLPLAGFGIGLIYHSIGKKAEGGNNLILEQIHAPGGGIPRRMAPLIFVTTLITHLFGGSVGREGTAVQLGGSMASAWGRMCGLKLNSKQMRLLLLSGVAAGFGAIFGTPIAGTIFALEVLTTAFFFRCDGFLIVLIAAVLGNLTCRTWGVNHLLYQLHDCSSHSFIFSPLLLGKALLIGFAAAIVVRIFVTTEHRLHQGFKRILPYAPLRPILGGLLILLLVAVVGTRSYLGLSEWSPNPHDITMTTLFLSPNPSYWAWAWKLLFTAVTLSSGFKGGEVTPLFFMGAALGNTLALLLGGPSDLFTALGFVAVFAGASNTPFACTIMGMELFGFSHAIPMALACFVSYFFSGQKGIYKSQIAHKSGSYFNFSNKI